MKKQVLGLVAAGALLAGCAMAASPVNGFWWTDVQWGMEVPGGNGAMGAKTGEAKCTSILGLVATGDASIEAAAHAGSINKVMSVSHHAKSIFGFFAEFTTTVTGE
jgi:hypothetical protein